MGGPVCGQKLLTSHLVLNMMNGFGAYMNYDLSSLKGGYMGDYIGDYYRAY